MIVTYPRPKVCLCLWQPIARIGRVSARAGIQHRLCHRRPQAQPTTTTAAAAVIVFAAETPTPALSPTSLAMSGVRAHLASRLRSTSLSAVPPPQHSSNYSRDLAKIASSILYRSPLPSPEGRPVFILNAAALPDSHDADYDLLLPYVLARLPEEDELLKGYEYEVVFFAGDGDGSATSKKHRPGWGWFLQAYHVLSRAMRKRLQRLYIVHEKAWVRILTEIFSTIVSPKFRRKIYHCAPSPASSLWLY